jgi:hypothetical protein
VAPRITGFSPLRAVAGASVSITGTTLGGVTAVRFGGVTAPIVSGSTSEVVATVPATAPTIGRITVVTPDGQSVSPTDFLVIRPPKVTSLSPAAAAVGATVTLGGTNLASAIDVSFNGVPVDRRVVLSNSALRVVVPLGATTGTVSVTNAAGSGTSAASFRVLPAITAVSPASGLIGDTVTISGTTFTGLIAVRFGAAAAGVVSSTDDTIVVTVPASATTGPVTVTTGAGTATSATPFEVIRPPTVSVSPAAAPPGSAVNLDGSGVGSATAVTFNNLAASFTRVSATRLRAIVPDLAVSGPVSVTNPAGTGAAAFRVTPKISAIDPLSGPVGDAITITGGGFVGVPGVLFGAAHASPTSVSLTAIVVAVPAGAGNGPVKVTTTEGTATSPLPFTVIVKPTLTSFTPTRGVAGTVVKLVGTSLTPTSVVKFNGVEATVSGNASVTTSLMVTVPAGATTGRITVTNAAGTVTSATDFHVPPTVTGFSPDAGEAGTLVTIEGSALNGASVVRVGGAVATIVSVTDTEVVAIVPGTATTGVISVTTPEGTAVSAEAFEVLAPATASVIRLRRLLSGSR